MAEERIIYRGHPSTATIFGSTLLSFVLLVGLGVGLFMLWRQIPTDTMRYAALGLLLVPVLFFLVKWIALKFLTYEITNERIKVEKGILSKRTDELELYRVRDTALLEPFILRLFSAGDILIITTDAATPQIEL